MTLTTDEIIRLSHLGYIVRIQRGDEVKCTHYGCTVWYPAADLKRIARPSLIDRIRHFLSERLAA